MRIAFISQHFYPEQFSNNAMARELVRRGHEVDAFAGVPNYPSGHFFPGYSNTKKRTETWEGVNINRILTVPRGQRKWSLIVNYLTYSIAGSIKVLFEKKRLDVVFVSQLSPVLMMMPGIVMKWKMRRKLVCWVQDIWPESATYTLGLHNRLVVAFLNTICGWLYRQADIVLVQSAAFHDMLTRFGVPPERIKLLPNTAPENYRPLTKEQARRYAPLVPHTGFKLMFAGNIGESQDFDTLIEAAVLLRERHDVHWLIVGSGRDEQRVKALVAKRGLDDWFHFLGRYPEEDMPSLFAHADAMLVSLKEIPIFALTVPYKTQCYMACGKPIIGSLNGEGARIINTSGAGIAVNAGEPLALADAIVKVATTTSDQRNAFSKNSRRYFDENFSASKVYDDLERVLMSAGTAEN